ncbi:FAD/NAD(P)-binding domain-containing protein [Thozetella sp. PMI_491]|nr:FAD/NAD(P)-binding domain-containing protein [Thozetella sp. PMI_491]
MIGTLRNVVVVGGSYVGVATAKELANIVPATHRVLLIEPHSHFHHLFAFPRFAIVPNYEHKAFIPYKGVFSESPDPSRHAVIKARVLSLEPTQLLLDREWEGSSKISFDYLVAATGTQLADPGTMPSDEKKPAIESLRAWQRDIKKANSIAVVGGGAVGVQMATDLKEVYPEKDITLIHSRDKLMPLYHVALSNLIKDRLKELGVRLLTGSRVVVPSGGFKRDGKPVKVELQDGTSLFADLVIPATGQTPNTAFLSGLRTTSEGSLINPANGFIRVRPTLQFQDPQFNNLFAVGDIADSGAHKAARPGVGQGAVAAKNIVSLIEGKEPTEFVTISPPGIHLTLGLTKNVIFRNPNPAEGSTEPVIKLKDDGSEDMSINGVWARRGVQVSGEAEYHL